MSDHEIKHTDDECCNGSSCRGISMTATSGHHIELVDHEETGINTGESEDLQEEIREENFFLFYHLHMQPSEVDALTPYQRKWIISRFIHQKQVEKELMEQMRRSQNGGIINPDFLKEIERTKNG